MRAVLWREVPLLRSYGDCGGFSASALTGPSYSYDAPSGAEGEWACPFFRGV